MERFDQAENNDIIGERAQTEHSAAPSEYVPPAAITTPLPPPLEEEQLIPPVTPFHTQDIADDATAIQQANVQEFIILPTSPDNQPTEFSATQAAAPVGEPEVVDDGEDTAPLPAIRGEAVAPPAATSVPPARRRISSRTWRIAAIVAAVLLVLILLTPSALEFLRTFLPANTAKITITPDSRDLKKTYTLTAIANGNVSPSANQIPARILTYTTPQQTHTVQSSGQHVNAANATGTLTFSGASNDMNVSAYVPITGNSGVQVETTQPVSLTAGGGAVTVPAQAVSTGSGGNIAAYDINGSYTVFIGFSFAGTVFIQNTVPFTGGHDASGIVQQSDIDNGISSLTSDLTSQAEQALQGQMSANDTVVGDYQCKPLVSADHKANDHVPQFNVSGTVTCTVEVYDRQQALQFATDQLHADAAQQLGSDYSLVGNVQANVVSSSLTDPQQGTVALTVSTEGIWVYQFTDVKQHQLAQMITGKTQGDTSTLLLHQKGISKVVIKTFNGWGYALPTSPSAITFVIVGIQGLF